VISFVFSLTGVVLLLLPLLLLLKASPSSGSRCFHQFMAGVFAGDIVFF
jgi:hypothetical protein